MSVNLDYLLFYPAEVASAVVALAVVRKADERRSARLWVASLGFSAIFLARTLVYAPQIKGWGTDFRIFWEAGRCYWEGRDPYTTITGLRPPNDRANAFLYPPQIIPIFALFSVGSLLLSAYVWSAFNAVLFLSIGLLGRLALVGQDGERYPVVGPALAALLATPVLLSRATSFGFDNGQLSMLTTISILAAIAAQGSMPRRATTAAAALALAAIKVATAIPFFMLFCRRSDRRIWPRFILISAGLILISGNPSRLPERISTMFASIAKLREARYMNDYSVLNPSSNSIISPEVAISRLGVADRGAVDAITKVTLVTLGLIVLYVVLGRSDVDRGASCSLVSFYSTLFLYHRIYDLSILVLPLLYAASRYRSGRGPARLCYLWIMIAVLLAINTPIALIRRVDVLPAEWATVKAFVVPMSIYLIVSAMIAQMIAIWIDRKKLPIKERLVVLREDVASFRGSG